MLLFAEPVQRWLSRWLLSKGPSPITVNVTSNYASIYSGQPGSWLGQSFYVPHAHLEKEPPDALLDWPKWIRSQGGAPEGEMFLLITLVCDADTTVVVRPPTVSVEHRSTGQAASRLRYQPQGGASMMPIVTFDVNLAMGMSMIANNPHSQITPLSWAMAKGEAQQFLIRARPSGTGLYSWSLRLPVIVGGRGTLLHVDDDGSPFQTVQLPKTQPGYFWAAGKWMELQPPPFAN